MFIVQFFVISQWVSTKFSCRPSFQDGKKTRFFPRPSPGSTAKSRRVGIQGSIGFRFFLHLVLYPRSRWLNHCVFSHKFPTHSIFVEGRKLCSYDALIGEFFATYRWLFEGGCFKRGSSSCHTQVWWVELPEVDEVWWSGQDQWKLWDCYCIYIYIYTIAMIKIDEWHTPDTSFLGAETLPFAFCALYLYLWRLHSSSVLNWQRTYSDSRKSRTIIAGHSARRQGPLLSTGATATGGQDSKKHFHPPCNPLGSNFWFAHSSIQWNMSFH